MKFTEMIKLAAASVATVSLIVACGPKDRTRGTIALTPGKAADTKTAPASNPTGKPEVSTQTKDLAKTRTPEAAKAAPEFAKKIAAVWASLSNDGKSATVTIRFEGDREARKVVVPLENNRTSTPFTNATISDLKIELVASPDKQTFSFLITDIKSKATAAIEVHKFTKKFSVVEVKDAAASLSGVLSALKSAVENGVKPEYSETTRVDLDVKTTYLAIYSKPVTSSTSKPDEALIFSGTGVSVDPKVIQFKKNGGLKEITDTATIMLNADSLLSLNVGDPAETVTIKISDVANPVDAKVVFEKSVEADKAPEKKDEKTTETKTEEKVETKTTEAKEKPTAEKTETDKSTTPEKEKTTK